jgi:hypothetical protein
VARILPHPTLLTIRIAPRVLTRALVGLRALLFLAVVVTAAVDIAIGVLALVAFMAWAWAWSVEGAQS